MMQDQERKTIQLSVAQVLAGALASVSAAVVASKFGLAGTLLGAAVTSVVATIGGALYRHSIERAHARVRLRVHRDPRTGALRHERLRAPRPRRRIAWGRVAAGAALVFALALGLLTALEVAAQAPMARLIGGDRPGAGTTVGAVVRQVGADLPAAAPEAATPTATPGAATATAAPGAAPTAPAPATKPARATATVAPAHKIAPTATAAPAPTEEPAAPPRPTVPAGDATPVSHR
ncbi:MAG TPA: hypothetical protein VFW96_02670 [Thermomicrobiales bacterium]|nr:hypothetical protein [Thermomicrobiales bacterium]